MKRIRLRTHYTPNELSALTGVKVMTIYQQLGRGTLPATRIRGRWHIAEDEARKYARDRGVDVGFWVLGGHFEMRRGQGSCGDECAHMA